jgi:hypothetical protein
MADLKSSITRVQAALERADALRPSLPPDAVEGLDDIEGNAELMRAEMDELLAGAPAVHVGGRGARHSRAEEAGRQRGDDEPRGRASGVVAGGVGPMSYDTALEKAIDQLLDSHGYSGASITTLPNGTVKLSAERPGLTHNGRFRLDATLDVDGNIIEKKERDW